MIPEPEIVVRWRAEAATKASQTMLLDVLEARVGSLPGDLTAAVRGTADMATLKRWALLAARAATLEEFRTGAGI